MTADWDTLVDALRGYGVRYLSGGTPASAEGAHAAGDGRRIEPDVLLARLAQSPDPRLRQALAAVFLVHPELAGVAPRVAETLPPPARDHLIHGYVAAVYLQRLWWTRLRRYLGDIPRLPPYWIAELGLPSPEDLFGRLGLVALVERCRESVPGQRRGRGQEARLGPYYRVGLLLLAQLLAERAAGVAHVGRIVA